MKKFYTLLVICIILLSGNNAKASEELEYDNVNFSGDTIYIEVEDENQKNNILAEIEKHNEKTKKLWEESEKRMVKNSDLLELQDFNKDVFFPLSTRTVFSYADNTIYDIIWPYRYTYTVSYELRDNIQITKFNWIKVGPNSSNLTTTLNGHTHRILDGFRTLAVNTTVRFGIISENNTTYKYMSDYIEFYSNGDSRVY